MDETGDAFTRLYHVKERLGDGGTAAVYAVVHRVTGEKLAVKIAVRRRQGSRWSRTMSVFQHEVAMLRRCQHPHIVQAHALYQSPNDLALVLEHVGGGDFQQLLERHGSLAEHAVNIVITQVVEALGHMHSVSVLHRDIKLENILLVRLGASPCVKLCDLGHAALVHSAHDSFTGTAGYSAPEVSDATSPAWSRAADVWSVGCVMYAMLANSLLVWASDGPDFSSRMLAQVRLLLIASDFFGLS